MLLRTAKSCGPDTPTLVSSSRNKTPRATVARKPGHRGECEVSRKTIARGMPDVFRCDLTNACAFYHYPCTRGYRAHRTPGIPCALSQEGKEFSSKPRAKQAARARALVPCIRTRATFSAAFFGAGGRSRWRGRALAGRRLRDRYCDVCLRNSATSCAVSRDPLAPKRAVT
jgi:hypothetical protein